MDQSSPVEPFMGETTPGTPLDALQAACRSMINDSRRDAVAVAIEVARRYRKQCRQAGIDPVSISEDDSIDGFTILYDHNVVSGDDLDMVIDEFQAEVEIPSDIVSQCKRLYERTRWRPEQFRSRSTEDAATAFACMAALSSEPDGEFFLSVRSLAYILGWEGDAGVKRACNAIHRLCRANVLTVLELGRLKGKRATRYRCSLSIPEVSHNTTHHKHN